MSEPQCSRADLGQAFARPNCGAKRLKLKNGAVFELRLTAAGGQLKVVRYVVKRRTVKVTYRCARAGASLKACT